jgi:hypothetical protein
LKKLSLALSAASVLIAVTAVPASARPARCVIAIDDNRYNGPCDFTSRKGGTFFLSAFRRSFNIRAIDVFVTRNGVGDARITPAGAKPIWGRALRSREESACWEGDTFKICVY